MKLKKIKKNHGRDRRPEIEKKLTKKEITITGTGKN